MQELGKEGEGMSDLLPCPFCKSEAHVWMDELSDQEWLVKCNVCFAHGPIFATRGIAKTLWNEVKR